MNFITSEWYDVDEFLPTAKDFVVVRCISANYQSADKENREMYTFYYYAHYIHDKWYIFNGNRFEISDQSVQVTHWSRGIKPEKIHKFKIKVESK